MIKIWQQKLEERTKSAGVNPSFQMSSEETTGTCAVLITNKQRFSNKAGVYITIGLGCSLNSVGKERGKIVVYTLFFTLKILFIL